MANLAKGNLIVKGLGGDVKINNTPLNNILVNHSYTFDRVTGELKFGYDNIEGVVSPDKVEITRVAKNGRKIVSGTNSMAGNRGRYVRCTSPVDGKSDTINISRLWMLVYHLDAGHIVLADVDKYYLNHMDNTGDQEGAIADNSGIDRDNYELCTKEQNDRHGKVWHIVNNKLGIKLKFSAYDTRFMTLVELYEEDVAGLKNVLKEYDIIKEEVI